MNTRKLTTSPDSTSVPPTHAQIAALAHEIWRERGQPEGSDVDIWLEAERQLMGGVPARPSHADPIPADPSSTSPDTDPALNPSIDRQLGRRRDPGDRGPTAFGL